MCFFQALMYNIIRNKQAKYTIHIFTYKYLCTYVQNNTITTETFMLYQLKLVNTSPGRHSTKIYPTYMYFFYTNINKGVGEERQ